MLSCVCSAFCSLCVRSEADHSIRIILQKYKTQLADQSLWNLLPELYGCAMLAPRWRSSYYQIAHEGYTNNMHCMAEGVRALIVAFQRMPLKAEISKQDVSKRIDADFDRFVKCAAYTILNMVALKTAEGGAAYPVANCMTFLEVFILNSGGRLQLAMLDDCFPYTLLRTNFIQIYQKQSASGG